MSWRPHGRAQVDPSAPSAFGVDDRSGFLNNLRKLKWEFQWAGSRLVNLRILTADPDKPQEQLRAIILPPDPPPVMNARPEDFVSEMFDFRTTQDGTQRVTQDGQQFVLDPGIPIAD